MGRPASRAISVRQCSLPSVNVIRIEVILLVTERPDSVELPATALPPTSSCDLRVGQENTPSHGLTSASFRKQHPQSAWFYAFPRVWVQKPRGFHRGERAGP